MIVKVWFCDFRKMNYLSMKSPTIVTKRRGHRKADYNPHGKTVIGLKEEYWNSLLLKKNPHCIQLYLEEVSSWRDNQKEGASVVIHESRTEIGSEHLKLIADVKSIRG